MNKFQQELNTVKNDKKKKEKSKLYKSVLGIEDTLLHIYFINYMILVDKLLINIDLYKILITRKCVARVVFYQVKA